jgi:hypothetical protein
LKYGGGERVLESRSVSIAWKLMMVPNIIVLVFGLVFTFIPDVMLSPGFDLFTGQTWSNFVSTSPEIADLFMLTAGRMFGVHILVMTIFALAITYYGFRKGERWSWYVLLGGYSLGLIFDAVAVSIIGQMEVVAVNLIMLLINYIALGIYAKDILGKK